MKIGYVVTTYKFGPWLQMTLDHLPEESRWVVIETPTHGGNLSRSWNYGINEFLAEGIEVVIVCNDDVLLRPDTGELLAFGLTGQQHFRDNGSLAWTDREILLLSARHAAPNDNRTSEADQALLDAAVPRHQPGPDFSAFCVDHRLFDLVGPFDEDLQVWFGDNDMHRRIQLAGYEAGAYAPFWHLLNGTIRSSAERQAAVHAIFAADKATYERKWGGPLGAETFAVPYGLQAVR